RRRLRPLPVIRCLATIRCIMSVGPSSSMKGNGGWMCAAGIWVLRKRLFMGLIRPGGPHFYVYLTQRFLYDQGYCLLLFVLFFFLCGPRPAGDPRRRGGEWGN